MRQTKLECWSSTFFQASLILQVSPGASFEVVFALLTNIRLARKELLGRNTLLYFAPTIIIEEAK